jgi:hypothetical protein
MQPETIIGYLDSSLTDMLNRYLNLLDDMGIVHRKKREKKLDEVLATRNTLLEHWVPIYAKHVAELAKKTETGDKTGKHI